MSIAPNIFYQIIPYEKLKTQQLHQKPAILINDKKKSSKPSMISSKHKGNNEDTMCGYLQDAEVTIKKGKNEIILL